MLWPFGGHFLRWEMPVDGSRTGDDCCESLVSFRVLQCCCVACCVWVRGYALGECAGEVQVAEDEAYRTVKGFSRRLSFWAPVLTSASDAWCIRAEGLKPCCARSFLCTLGCEGVVVVSVVVDAAGSDQPLCNPCPCTCDRVTCGELQR